MIGLKWLLAHVGLRGKNTIGGPPIPPPAPGIVNSAALVVVLLHDI